MIDKSKQYRTRDGREVRIYATDGCNGHRVHGAIYEGKASGWAHRAWFKDGRMHGAIQSDADLIEVRPRIKREVWINVYRGRETDWVTVHDKREDADADRSVPCIACVKLTIDCEEGEGLL